MLLWRKAATFEPARAGVSTWIFTIARNLRIDRHRRQGGNDAETRRRGRAREHRRAGRPRRRAGRIARCAPARAPGAGGAPPAPAGAGARDPALLFRRAGRTPRSPPSCAFRSAPSSRACALPWSTCAGSSTPTTHHDPPPPRRRAAAGPGRRHHGARPGRGHRRPRRAMPALPGAPARVRRGRRRAARGRRAGAARPRSTGERARPDRCRRGPHRRVDRRECAPRRDALPRRLPAGMAWPRSLRGSTASRWRWLGPGMRWCRVTLADDRAANVFLLRIAAGKSLPSHTHDGSS